MFARPEDTFRSQRGPINLTRTTRLLFCQPRVEVTSCFVYKIMGLTFRDRINTQLIYLFELAQVEARRITKQQRFFLGSNLTGCSFLISFLSLFFWLVDGGPILCAGWE